MKRWTHPRNHATVVPKNWDGILSFFGTVIESSGYISVASWNWPTSSWYPINLLTSTIRFKPLVVLITYTANGALSVMAIFLSKRSSILLGTHLLLELQGITFGSWFRTVFSMMLPQHFVLQRANSYLPLLNRGFHEVVAMYIVLAPSTC